MTNESPPSDVKNRTFTEDETPTGGVFTRSLATQERITYNVLTTNAFQESITEW